MLLIQKEIDVLFLLICAMRLSFHMHVAEHESEEEESEGDDSESLLDDACPTSSSVQLNAVTAIYVGQRSTAPT